MNEEMREIHALMASEDGNVSKQVETRRFPQSHRYSLHLISENWEIWLFCGRTLQRERSVTVTRGKRIFTWIINHNRRWASSSSNISERKLSKQACEQPTMMRRYQVKLSFSYLAYLFRSFEPSSHPRCSEIAKRFDKQSLDEGESRE